MDLLTLGGGGHTDIRACLLAGLSICDSSAVAVGSVKSSLTPGEGMTNHS